MQYSIKKKANGWAYFDKALASQIMLLIKRFIDEDSTDRKLEPQEYEPTIKIEFLSGEMLRFSDFKQIEEYRNSNSIIRSIDIDTSTYLKNSLRVSISYYYGFECETTIYSSTSDEKLHSFAVQEIDKIVDELYQSDYFVTKAYKNVTFDVVSTFIIMVYSLYMTNRYIPINVELLIVSISILFIIIFLLFMNQKDRFIYHLYPVLEYEINHLKFTRKKERNLVLPLASITLAIIGLIPLLF